MIEYLLSFALASVSIWYLARSHFNRSITSALTDSGPDAAEALRDQRQRCLQVLKDLELDYHMRKIAEQDYQQMKRAISRELGDLMARSSDPATSKT